MTNRRHFLKQTATLAALGTLSYPVQADERATKNTAAKVAPPLPPTDIRSLTQHFNQPGGGIEPWMFVPKSNIAEISTEEHPGDVTVRQAGKAEDIKGILRKPVGIEPEAETGTGSFGDMDLSPLCPPEEVGREIFEKIIAVAGGEQTKSEAQGIGDEEFAPWSIGPTL